jgi:hypothetical protein
MSLSPSLTILSPSLSTLPSLLPSVSTQFSVSQIVSPQLYILFLPTLLLSLTKLFSIALNDLFCLSLQLLMSLPTPPVAPSTLLCLSLHLSLASIYLLLLPSLICLSLHSFLPLPTLPLAPCHSLHYILYSSLHYSVSPYTPFCLSLHFLLSRPSNSFRSLPTISLSLCPPSFLHTPLQSCRSGSMNPDPDPSFQVNPNQDPAFQENPDPYLSASLSYHPFLTFSYYSPSVSS